jgi:hypothetical protein
MKIKLLVFTSLILNSVNAFSQTMYQQYFDGADTSASNSIIINLDTSCYNNVWQVGKPQKTIFHSAATVPNVIVTDTINNYPPNDTSRFAFSFYNQYPWNPLAVQWMQKLDMDRHRDGGIIEFSGDSGATWQNAFNNTNVLNFYGYQTANKDTLLTGEYAFSGKDTNWRNVWLCIKPNMFPNMNQKVMFRFTLKTDSINNSHEGWMIDNMMMHPTFVHPVNEMKMAQNLKVYPTLTEGIIRIEDPSGKEQGPLQTIELFGVDGKLLEKYTNRTAKYSIDIHKYEAGMYFLKISTDIRTENHPIMLLKN